MAYGWLLALWQHHPPTSCSSPGDRDAEMGEHEEKRQRQEDSERNVSSAVHVQ